MSERDARLARLQEANDYKRAESRARVEAVLDERVRWGHPINVHAVAVEARVSRSFVYSQEDLLARIRQLKADGTGIVRANARTPASEASLRRRLSDALERIGELKSERDRLQEQVSTLLGENRRLRRGRTEG